MQAMTGDAMGQGTIHRLSSRKPLFSKSPAATALVAKQPIFDLRGHIWGYELLFRDPSLKPGLADRSSEAATSTVMIDGFSLLRPLLRDKQRFLINFTADFLEAELPAVLPPDICTIEILETVDPTESVLQGLANLKKQGYMLALDDYVGQEELAPFLPLVDIIKVEVLGQSSIHIANLCKKLKKRYKTVLLAEKVEDRETASFCRSQGFSLFQGFFFSKAEIISGATLNPSQVTKTRLLALTADPNMQLKQINAAISSDVFLTYRLMKFINSVYFGLPMKIRTIEHATALLGLRKVRQWLLVTALAGLDSSPMSQEIVYISAYRAKYLELLSLRRNPKENRELASKLFITGLFSLLEGLMRVPPEEIFTAISLDPEVYEVLGQGTGPLAPWYQLMGAYEQGHWPEVHELADKLSLQDWELSNAYVEAGKWSSAVFQSPDS